MLTEVLLVPGTIPAIFDEIFPFLDQKIITCRVLAGHRTVTALTRHEEEYISCTIKVCE